jgi:PPK2 family polyphosphate:nucleotide phosphotransferase
MDFNQFIVRPDKRVKLSEIDSRFTGEFADEAAARESIENATRELVRHQEMLFAHEKNALVIIFQGMDASGKDEAIQDVLSHIDPQGCKATQFSKPTEGEVKHDYLRRFIKALPESGQIGVFNRSYYEQLVGDRVHEDRVHQWNMGPKIQGDELWQQRSREVNNLEQYLSHVSKEQQRKRLLERICKPEMNWQFSLSDMDDRARWDEFMQAYEDTLNNTSTQVAPWHVIPADHRWFNHLVVAAITAQALKELHDDYPEMDDELKQKMQQAREQLEKEGE